MENMTTYQNGSNPAIQSVLYAMELTGFNPKNIDDNGVNLIINVIKRSFPKIGTKEFREAFELGVTGKLDVNLQTYQSFNSLYVSNVLQAYDRYKISQRNKPEVLTLEAPAPSSEWEKKRAFDIIKDEIFLKDDDRNCPAGTFPELTLASWKDAHRYMIEQGLIQELTGAKREEMIKQSIARLRIEERDPKKRIANALNTKAIDTKEAPMMFYKMRVVDWFEENVDSLV